MSRETAREIEAAAAAWAARADRGLSAEEEVALAAWLDGDPRRPGAYARLTWALMSTERAAALGARFDPSTPRATLTRRAWFTGAGGLVAASAAGVGAWGLLGLEKAYATRKGEVKVVSLDDGAVVTLNTETRIAVRYSREARRLRLISGEALFDVPADAGRPFVVEAGPTTVRAAKACFTVSRLSGEPVVCLVRQGQVEVTRPAAQPARAPANTRVVTSPDGKGTSWSPMPSLWRK